MNRKLYAAFAAVTIAIMTLSSCVSTEEGVKQTPDEKAIDRGVTAWNEKSPSAAKPYWSAISLKASRDQYVGYVYNYEAGADALEKLDGQKSPDDSKLSAAYEKIRSAVAGLPKNLTVPQETRGRAVAVAETRMRSLINANKLTAASELGKSCTTYFGTNENIDSMNAEIAVILSSRKREADADAALESARAIADFDEKIAAFESTASQYGKAETDLASDAKAADISKSPGVAVEASSLRKKRQKVATDVEQLLRDRAYSFKDRIGEEFARQPEGNKTGILGMEEILKHYQGVKANVDASFKEMKDFAARYPKAIDADMIAEIEDQKAELDVQIAKVAKELATAKEIASRGKVAMPLLIGLFNPAPGKDKEEDKKSRPALFAAKDAKKNEYWWGMVSIPAGKMNDLVVTMKDTRTVRVFGENTKSGTLIDKNGLKDLVNRGYKVGDSWPVLNAGKTLPTDKYFFEVQKGATSDYEGEVVIYNSFVSRQR
jgi:hypothetical protein